MITPTANLQLEQALRFKLQQRAELDGGLGLLEPLALRLGLIQNTLRPRFRAPQITLFAADHGLAVDGIGARHASTSTLVARLLNSQLPVAVYARLQGLELTVVDCGMAEAAPPHARLQARKIAHGTRNARVTSAMVPEQAHAAIRAGQEIADALPGNAVACAGIGVGSNESAALVLSRLGDVPLADLLNFDAGVPHPSRSHYLQVLQAAQARHKNVVDAIDVLAAFGGYETAMMVGVMLAAASKRQLVLVDGLAACAALMVAARIAPAVIDYCIHCRSTRNDGLDTALELFNATALLELGIDGTDGTGSALAWPLVRCAAALLTEVADGADPGPSQPGTLSDTLPGTLPGNTTATVEH